MNRFLVMSILCALVGLVVWLGPGSAADGPSGTTLVAQLGDRIRVVDAPLGCRVVRVPDLGGRVALDCRRSGPLRGRLGTLLTAREAALVRFENANVGRLVVIADHDGELRRCR